MASLKVFVSSTAYDLGVLRSSLRQSISQMGMEPVLSEFSAVLYDPREHTHVSCIAEVRNCDMLVLVVGSRFGGEVVPEVVTEVSGAEYEKLLAGYEAHKLSVTQAEVLTALSQSIPIFVFVDAEVMHDYRVYLLNRGTEIKYPSVEQEGTAEYIFNFIDFLQSQSYNNAVQTFSRLEDIQQHLLKQWPAMFQRLLQQDRESRDEHRRIDRLTEQFEDLKTALLTSVGDKESRTIARAVVRYRRMVDVLRSLPDSSGSRELIATSSSDWPDLLLELAGIVAIEPVRDGTRALLVLEDGSGLFPPVSPGYWRRLEDEWEAFRAEEQQLKRVIYDELLAAGERGQPPWRKVTVEEVTDLLARRDAPDEPAERESGTLASDEALESLRRKLTGR